jgi:methylmalonyl-CoA/ethylmalonyl-CoA epimerase
MEIDHIAIAVRDIRKSMQNWIDLFGYKQITDIVLNTKQKVNVVFMGKSDSITIKLIEASEDSSPLNNFMKKMGGGIHHICFKTNDLLEKVDELKKNGMILTSTPLPGEAFENELIAFLMGKDNLRIEVIDTDKKANRIV